jgi:hypothetical protein
MKARKLVCTTYHLCETCHHKIQRVFPPLGFAFLGTVPYYCSTEILWVSSVFRSPQDYAIIIIQLLVS